MNGTEGGLYISWKHNELDYYVQKVSGFLLQKPNDYLEFRKYVRNIIDWGKDKRSKAIRDSLASLLEESSGPCGVFDMIKVKVPVIFPVRRVFRHAGMDVS